MMRTKMLAVVTAAGLLQGCTVIGATIGGLAGGETPRRAHCPASWSSAAADDAGLDDSPQARGARAAARARGVECEPGSSQDGASSVQRGTKLGTQIGLTVDALVVGAIVIRWLYGSYLFADALEEDFGPP
jgi:hypothetical protein